MRADRRVWHFGTLLFFLFVGSVFHAPVVFAQQAQNAAVQPLEVRRVSSAAASTVQTCDFESQTCDFEDVPVGETESIQFLLNNPNPEATIFISSVIVLPDDGVFGVVTPQAGATIPPMGQLQVEITFTPLTLGFQEAELLIDQHNADTEDFIGTFELLMRGTGVQAIPVIDVDPLALNFGPVAVGGSRLDGVTIENTGNSDLEVFGIRLSGTYANEYSLGGATGVQIIPPGASRIVEVTFHPSSFGMKPAVLEIESHDPQRPLVQVSLNGEGMQTAPQLSVAPSEIDFGPVMPGESEMRDITVTNTGDAVLNVNSIQVQGDDAADFNVNPGSLTINPGASQTVAVTFGPSRRGDFIASVAFQSNGGMASVRLTGQGVVPQIMVPASVSFPTTLVGNTSAQSFQISNSGDAPLTVSNMQVVNDAGNFRITGGAQVPVLAPGASHTVEVTFSPVSGGLKTNNLAITSDDPARRIVNVALSGQADGVLGLSSSAVDFETVVVGASETRVVVAENPNDEAITITALDIQGATAFSSPLAVPVSIGPNGTLEFPFVYAPTTRGAEEATVRITTDVEDSPPLEVALMGTGVAPILQVDPPQLVFGEAAPGQELSLPLTVLNVGDSPLDISSLTITGADAEAFAVSGNVPFSVAPAHSEERTLFFTPQRGGTHTATLQLVSNDLAQPTLNVALSGEGGGVQNNTNPLATLEQDAPVSFSVPASFAGANGTLFYKPAGAQSFQSMALQGAGQAFSGVIDGSAVDIRGIQYYATFQAGDETITEPPINPMENPAEIRVQIPEVSSPLDLQPAQYAMVSFPFDIVSGDLETVLGDDFGPYDQDAWRLLRWDPITEAYTEFPDITEGGVPVVFAAGRAGWLITAEGPPYDAANAVSTSAATPQQVVLQPGHNQIGNPFAFPVAWEDVVFEGDVDPPVAFNGTYQQGQTVLQPWSGYFVFNNEPIPVTLEIPALEATQTATVPLAERYARAGAFVMQVEAALPGDGGKDLDNYLVMASGANKSAIPSALLELREPPPLAEDVRLYIAEGGKQLAASVKDAEAGGQTWDVEVTAAFAATERFQKREVAVRLYESGVRPEGYQVWIVDLDDGRLLEGTAGRYEVTLEERRPSRRLRVVVGTESFAGTAAEGIPLGPTELLSNYPNPFTEHTEIAFRLGVDSAVRVEVFDVLGRRVRTLLEAERAVGHHAVVWDGRDDAGRTLASGLYVCRLQADTFTSTRQLVLLR